MLICMLFLFLTPPLYLLTHLLLHFLFIYIYLYKFVKFLPSTLNLRMMEQQSKCCLLLPVILTTKNVLRKRKSQHTFLGLAWAMHDVLMKYEGFWFFILYHPWLDVSSHSHLIITNRLLSLLFHVDVVEQLRWWVIIILHLFSVSHQIIVFKPNYKFLSNYLVVFCFFFFFLFLIKLYFLVIIVDFSVSCC